MTFFKHPYGRAFFTPGVNESRCFLSDGKEHQTKNGGGVDPNRGCLGDFKIANAKIEVCV